MRARSLQILIALVFAACTGAHPPPPVNATPREDTTPPPVVPRIEATTPETEKQPERSDETLPTVADFGKGKRQQTGLFDVLVDEDRAKLYLILPRPENDDVVAELIYVEGLLQGIGSNPIGADRGQLGDTRVVRLRRIGRKLFVEQPNLAYRASTDDPNERRAVEHSFATSVLWSGSVVAEDDDRFVVDFTGFVVRDAHGIARTLEARGEGSYSLDATRSTFDPGAVLAFPDNLEFEAILTFSGKKPGPELRSVTPTPEAVTIVQHHSLVRLPDDGYTPREFDPRAGSFAVEYLDYGAGLTEPMRKKLVARHRLKKKHSGPQRSKVEEPIVYYVDPGAPEPVRQALIDGASWWAVAFERAGFVDAFRVELLPEGAHPLDVRYNVIQWVHRATRGWSYGGGVIDPRTGEILKGHVSLGSLRVRQDQRIFEGLFGADASGTGAPDDPVQLALARIRQLAAHEVGHTLGLRHNFAASTYAGRASVMDYPAPLITVTADGELDASQAYTANIGVWDVFAIMHAYAEFEPGEEAQGLEALVQGALTNGFRFASDADARPLGSAHPYGHLWDNGPDPVLELERVLDVRRIAIDRFGTRALAPGRSLSLLEETFVPIYFYHRYQTEAAVKWIGGVDYRPNLNGDGQPLAQRLAPSRQRAALAAVLKTLDPEVLDIPDSVLAALVPDTAAGVGRTRERFRGDTAPIFDARSAATAAMDLTVRALLDPQRCARLAEQARLEGNALGLDETLDALLDTAFDKRAPTERLRGLQRALQRVVVDRCIELAADARTSDAVRSIVEQQLGALQRRLVRRSENEGPDGAHDAMLARDLDRFLNQREWTKPEGWRSPPAPPGSPIGAFESAIRSECCFAGTTR